MEEEEEDDDGIVAALLASLRPFQLLEKESVETFICGNFPWLAEAPRCPNRLYI